MWWFRSVDGCHAGRMWFSCYFMWYRVMCVCVIALVGLFRSSVALYGCILCCDSVCDGVRGVVSCCGDVGMVV